jgi:hypothetical protein
MLSVTYKPLKLSVIMFNVVMLSVVGRSFHFWLIVASVSDEEK